MGALYHEHHAEIVRWPWKTFCSKWARMAVVAARQQEEQEAREIEEKQRELMMAGQGQRGE